MVGSAVKAAKEEKTKAWGDEEAVQAEGAKDLREEQEAAKIVANFMAAMAAAAAVAK